MRKSIGIQKCGSRYRVRWTDEYGVRQSCYLYSKKDAELLVLEKKLKVERVKTGLLDRVNEDRRFKDLCEYYITNVVYTKRSPKDLISIINTHLLPFFAELKLFSINQEVCQRFVISRAHLSKKTNSNHLALLISMLNIAVDIKPESAHNRIKLIQKIF